MTRPSATARRLFDGPMTVRLVELLLKLLVAAESKNASFSLIACATAALSAWRNFHRTRRRSHLRLLLDPGMSRMDLGL